MYGVLSSLCSEALENLWSEGEEGRETGFF